MSDEFTTPEQFRSELRGALLAHSFPVPRRQSQPLRWRGLRVGFGAAAAVGAAAIAAVVLGLGAGGEFAAPPASAASVLRTSASALQRSGRSLALVPGAYLYTKTATWFRYTQLAPRPIVVRSIHEEWIARDGTGRDRNDVVSDSRGPGGPRGTRPDPRTTSCARRHRHFCSPRCRRSRSPTRNCAGCRPTPLACARSWTGSPPAPTSPSRLRAINGKPS